MTTVTEPGRETKKSEKGPALDTTAQPPDLVRPFMDHLTDKEREALTAQANIEHCPAGQTICHEGETGADIHIVQSGRIAVYKEADQPHPTLLGYRGAGEIIGEMSLLGSQPRSATVIADQDSEVLRIEAGEFLSLMEAHPGISRAVLQVLSSRLHAADTARTAIVRQEWTLIEKVQHLTGEALHLADLARVRQETIELIAHDLRTPLSVIDGCLQMLESTLPEDILASSADIIKLAKHSTGRLASMLEELLSAAQETALNNDASQGWVDLEGIIASVVQSSEFALKQAELDLKTQIDGPLPPVWGNAIKLERVLRNLVDNAIAYTPAEGRILIQARQGDGRIKVSVIDSGPGVPAEHRTVIFERFTRIPGVKGRKHGFGLGLYYCRQVILAHGGAIWVEPGPGNVGSRFSFTLPLARPPVHEGENG